MEILAAVQSKGGVGKSTLVISLAAAFRTQLNKRVAIIDCDPIGAAQCWHSQVLQLDDSPLAGIDLYTVTTPRELNEIKSMQDDYDIVILDTAGHDNATAKKAIEVSDHILLPCRAGVFDIKASKHTTDMISECGKLDKVLMILTMTIHRAGLTADAREAIGQLYPEIRLLEAEMRTYAGYSNTLANGQTVLDCNSLAARSNFTQIFNEIRSTIAGA